MIALPSVPLAASAAEWLIGFGTVLTGAAALAALVLVGWMERQRLATQHWHERRRTLEQLINRFHGRLLEAAVDWDRRMSQLYGSPPAPLEWGAPKGATEVEAYLNDRVYFEDEEWYIHGKFEDEQEYEFRQYVLAFLSLCGLARRFEREAMYIDADYATARDLQFLKYAKALIWAVTCRELHEDVVPSKDHFPDGEFRSILDECYPDADGPGISSGESETPGIGGSVPMLTLDRLDALVRENHKAHLARITPPTIATESESKAVPVSDASEGSSQSEEGGDPDGGSQRGTPSRAAGDFPPAKGIGRVLLFFNGLQKNHREFDRLRHNRDRLCVLHLVVIGFINEFGYRWQRHSDDDVKRAVDEIVDSEVCHEFAGAIPGLGLIPDHAPRQAGRSPETELDGRQVESGAPMQLVRVLLEKRVADSS